MKSNTKNAKNATPVSIRTTITIERESEDTLKSLKEDIRKLRKKLCALKKRVSSVFGMDYICLDPKLIPKHFEIPEFEKFDGTTNPHCHLRNYFIEMSQWSQNEKFLTHYFWVSLTGPALIWFWQQQKHTKFEKWKALGEAFVKRFKLL